MKSTQSPSFLWTLLSLICFSLFTACRPTPTQPETSQIEESITVTPRNVTLKIGDKTQLQATIQSKKSKSKITWKSEDNNIVKVSSNGEIEALQVGNTMITAHIEGSQIQASCLVMVIAGEQPTPPEERADVEIVHSFAKGYSIVLNVATRSGKILVDRGNGTQNEYVVSTHINNPTQVSITAEDKEKIIRIYASDLLLLNTDNNIHIEQINLLQASQLQELSALGNHLKSIDLQAAPNLQKLNLEENKFTGTLNLAHDRLTHCNLSHNSVSGVFLSLPNLTELDLAAMNLSHLPSWNQNHHLKRVAVDHNKLSEEELKKAISNLPKRSGEKGKMIVLNAKNATPESNEVVANTLIPLAEQQGWELYDGDVKLQQSTEKEDPKGLNIVRSLYLQWNNSSIETIKAWEKNNKGTFNANLSETEDEGEILLVFDVAGEEIYKRIYTLEGSSLLQVEIFVHPLSLLLVPGEGAKLRLNKNFEKSLKNGGYTSLGEGYNTFRYTNDKLKSDLIISKEVEKQEQIGKLLFSPKR